MTLSDIRKIPTVIDEIEPSATGAHESVMRSFHVMRKVKEWLELRVPHETIIEMIDDCYSDK